MTRGGARLLPILLLAACAAEPPARPSPAPARVSTPRREPSPSPPAPAAEPGEDEAWEGLQALVGRLEISLARRSPGDPDGPGRCQADFQAVEAAEALLRQALETRRRQDLAARRAADEDLRGLELVKDPDIRWRLRNEALARRQRAEERLQRLGHSLAILDPAAAAAVDIRRRMEEAGRRSGARLATRGILAERLQLARRRCQALAPALQLPERWVRMRSSRAAWSAAKE